MTHADCMIRAEKITKNFRYWQDRPESIKTILVDILRRRFKFGTRVEFTALQEISFEIRRGEFVGIMGRNGAGKSTLLKILAGIYSPSAGNIEIKGQLAPLIELGAGFNGELSGFENIFLNAAILGFGRKATTDAVPSILEFAELGDMIYMPVKNYSSGMLVRLGFAIATHLTAPIILVDEVLAVGDAGFQEKCIRKIHQLHGEGRTIILVTHSPEAVKQHCSRCIVLDKHRVVFDGSAEQGVNTYLQVCS